MAYDLSTDYARYPTLAPLPVKMGSGSADYISCSVCSGTTFRLRRTDMMLVCTHCGQPMKLPTEPAAVTKAVVPAATRSGMPVLISLSSTPFFCCTDGKVEAYDYDSGDGSVKCCTGTEFIDLFKEKHGQCDVGGWSEITTVAAGAWHTLGLRSDGTVLTVGDNGNGQCNLQNWSNITAIGAGYYHSVGLRRDGTVLAVGQNSDGQCNVRGWTNITAIAVGFTRTLGLRSDGTVLAAGTNHCGDYNVQGWTEISALALSLYHTAALRRDGTVIVTGRNERGELDDVQNWTGITAIAATLGRIFGLHEDGTLRMTGYIGWFEEQILAWHDIVSIQTFGEHIVATQSDGTFRCNHPEIEKLLNSQYR